MSRVPPARVVGWVEKLRDGLGGIQRRLVPPSLALMDFVTGMWRFQVVHAVAELEIADALAGGPRSAAELARARELDAERLYRLLRAAAEVGVLEELPERRFALTPLGRSLRRDDPTSPRDFILLQGRFGARHWGRLLDCVRDGRTAIELEHGVKPFEWLTGNPEAAATFNPAMTGVSNMLVEPILSAYDFGAARAVVDVGGGHGRMLGAILQAAPDARGILFDQASVVVGAGPLLRQLGVAERCEIVAGDFFARGSIPAGDLHFLKSVVHDWDDDDAVRLLANVRRAMPVDGRLLLVETVLPGPGEHHLGKLLDLEMLVHSGGRERTRDQYARLLAAAGLRLTRVIPTASPASLVEARPVAPA